MIKRIAVVGCGDWGKNLVRNFHTLGALHTICSSKAKTRQYLAGKYPGSLCPYSSIMIFYRTAITTLW